MGVLKGIVTLSNQSGVFEKEDFGLCKFNIEFKKSSVEIKTIDNGYDCDYGNGVYSDGKFILKSKGIPKLD